MSELKRYDLDCDLGVLMDSDGGRWVKYENVEHIERGLSEYLGIITGRMLEAEKKNHKLEAKIVELEASNTEFKETLMGLHCQVRYRINKDDPRSDRPSSELFDIVAGLLKKAYT